MANKSTLQCQQEGTFHVRIYAGKHWKDAVFTNVLYVPCLGVNLLSVQTMTKAGLHLNFTQHGCVIRNKKRQIIGYDKAEQSLYHLTVPRTPQQNGVAERANRTVMEAARSMLHAVSQPMKFWGAAVATAVYLRNRSPTRALNGVTPYEAWRGEKPDLSHLRV